MRDEPEPEDRPATGLRAVLGPFDATMIVMGSIIGAGIFRVPAQIAAAAGDPRWILALWVLGGAVSLCGALVFAELGASLPRAGGQYVFVREAFGRCAAFLLGWVLLTTITSGAVAYVAGVFAEHLATLVAVFLPGSEFGPRVLQATAVLLIAFLALLNARGLRLGALVQNAAMLTKILGLLLLIALGVGAGLGWLRGTPQPPAPPPGAPDWHGLGAALISVTFAYGGFQNVATVAGEMRDPRRDLPRAIALGTVAVIVLYLALNASLVAILGVDGVAATATPVAAAAGAVVPHGEALVAVLVMISTFAIVQVLLMLLPRVFYAMARDGLFFASVGRVHPRFGTPHLAVWALAGLSILHVLFSAGLHDLLEICSLCDWIFFALCALAVFVLRARRPDLPRPFQVPGHPWISGLFLVAAVAIVINAVVNAQPRPVILGLGLFALGGAFYAFWRGRAPGPTSGGR